MSELKGAKTFTCASPCGHYASLAWLALRNPHQSDGGRNVMEKRPPSRSFL